MYDDNAFDFSNYLNILSKVTCVIYKYGFYLSNKQEEIHIIWYIVFYLRKNLTQGYSLRDYYSSSVEGVVYYQPGLIYKCTSGV